LNEAYRALKTSLSL